MMLKCFESGEFQANCYIMTLGDGQECIIIDPGMDSCETAIAVIDGSELTPVGILATHGHVDHIAEAAPLATHYSVPVWIHPDDEPLLFSPEKGLWDGASAWLSMMLPQGLPIPPQIEYVSDGQKLTMAGMEINVIHAPGHTRGSVIYTVADNKGKFAFTGDVLFAGSIGRTDMQDGDMEAMLESLRGPVLAFPDQMAIFPGHGPESTMVKERATNPYLQPRFLNRSDLG
ncbi:MAG: MBL fold metallo-hydrolase [Propionibacteriaceae bacterium]|jgi:glyoxylase-like metal-dependent hydrolase (beta-lactamase superfamily II)|nr:MBL fold metallo-hydrolase [Propionibacteriaceae bacterium]